MWFWEAPCFSLTSQGGSLTLQPAVGSSEYKCGSTSWTFPAVDRGLEACARSGTRLDWQEWAPEWPLGQEGDQMMIRRPWPCQPEWWPAGKNYPIRHSHDPAGVEWGWEAEGGIKIFLNYKNCSTVFIFRKKSDIPKNEVKNSIYRMTLSLKCQNITQKLTNNPIFLKGKTSRQMTTWSGGKGEGSRGAGRVSLVQMSVSFRLLAFLHFITISGFGQYLEVCLYSIFSCAHCWQQGQIDPIWKLRWSQWWLWLGMVWLGLEGGRGQITCGITSTLNRPQHTVVTSWKPPCAQQSWRNNNNIYFINASNNKLTITKAP